MAPEKATKTVLEGCTEAMLVGNTISVRMLEYVSTARRPTKSLRSLAYDFLDTCRVLWSIEAALSDPAARQGRPFPSELTAEMCRKIGLARAAFGRLDVLLARFLDCERAAGFSRFLMRLRVGLFGDGDISRVRDALAKSKEALRMSAVVLHWSLGENPPRIPGFGFSGLAAALERMEGKSTAPPMEEVMNQAVENAQEEEDQESRSDEHVSGEDHESDAESFTTLPAQTPHLPPQLPPMPEFAGRIMSTDYLPFASHSNHHSLHAVPPSVSLPPSPATTRPPTSKQPSYMPSPSQPTTPASESYNRWLQDGQSRRASQAVPDMVRLSKLLAAKTATRPKGSTSSRGEGGDTTSECATENDTLVDMDDLHHQNDARLAKRAELYVRSRRSVAYSLNDR